MSTRTLLLWMLAGWVVVEILTYALLVPQALSTAGFVYFSAVLVLLVVVAMTLWRHSGPEKSIEDVLYETEHPDTRRTG